MDNRGRRSDSRNALVCVMEVMVDLPLSLNALVVHLKPPINITCHGRCDEKQKSSHRVSRERSRERTHDDKPVFGA